MCPDPGSHLLEIRRDIITQGVILQHTSELYRAPLPCTRSRSDGINFKGDIENLMFTNVIEWLQRFQEAAFVYDFDLPGHVWHSVRTSV